MVKKSCKLVKISVLHACNEKERFLPLQFKIRLFKFHLNEFRKGVNPFSKVLSAADCQCARIPLSGVDFCADFDDYRIHPFFGTSSFHFGL